MKQKFNPAQTFDLGWVKVELSLKLNIEPSDNKIRIREEPSGDSLFAIYKPGAQGPGPFCQVIRRVKITPDEKADTGCVFYVKNGAITLARIIFPEKKAAIPSDYPISQRFAFGTVHWNNPDYTVHIASEKTPNPYAQVTFASHAFGGHIVLYANGDISRISQKSGETFRVKALSNKVIKVMVMLHNDQACFEAFIELD